MKKLLALVLALVMTLGLATVGANAADFKDQAAVDKNDYSEAIKVLHGMGVFKGDDNGNFNPDDLIDRASVAAMIYRLYTADTAGKQESIYAGYGQFTDLTQDWYKGYIGYCANAEFIKGDGAGHFYPSEKVTGYQALAMILRATGYNKQNDFTGDDWELRVAETAQQRGLVKNVSATTLKAPASRALVAEILFEAAQIAQVTYTPALGYSMYVNNGLVVTNGQTLTLNDSLGWKNFRLTKDSDEIDDWGRPSYIWYGEYSTKDATEANAKLGTVYTYGTGDKSYAPIAYKPDAEYTTAKTECDISHDIGLTVNTEYTIYLNGDTYKYTIQPTDTINKIGGQGTITEVYKAHKRVVVINTFLAKVTNVTPVVKDANGHVVVKASLVMDVYDRDTTDGTTATSVTLRKDTDYTYAKGDMLLLNAYTNKTDCDPVQLRRHQEHPVEEPGSRRRLCAGDHRLHGWH